MKSISAFESRFGEYKLSNGFSSTSKKKLIKDSSLVDMHIAKTGEFLGYEGGEFQLTRKMFDNMISNFESESNPIPVYRGHADIALLPNGEEPRAAGWILSLKRIGDDLWATVELTEELENQIKSGEFKFTSIYMRMNEKHRQTGKKIGSRLVSLAVTNQPFIDGLQEISLSDSLFKHFDFKSNIYKSKDIKLSDSNRGLIMDKEKLIEMLTKVKESNPEMDLSMIEELVKAAVEEDKKDPDTDTTTDLPVEVETSEVEQETKEEMKTEEEVSAAEIEIEVAEEEEEKKPEEVEMACKEVKAAEIADDEKAMLEELKSIASEKSGEELDMRSFLEMIKSMLQPTEDVAASNLAFALSTVKAELDKTKKENSDLKSLVEKFEDEKIENWAQEKISLGLFHASKKEDWKKLYKSDKNLCLSILSDKTPEIVLSQISENSNKDAMKKEHILLSDHEKKILEGARGQISKK